MKKILMLSLFVSIFAFSADQAQPVTEVIEANKESESVDVAQIEDVQTKKVFLKDVEVNEEKLVNGKKKLVKTKLKQFARVRIIQIYAPSAVVSNRYYLTIDNPLADLGEEVGDDFKAVTEFSLGAGMEDFTFDSAVLLRDSESEPYNLTLKFSIKRASLADGDTPVYYTEKNEMNISVDREFKKFSDSASRSISK